MKYDLNMILNEQRLLAGLMQESDMAWLKFLEDPVSALWNLDMVEAGAGKPREGGRGL